MKTPHVVSLLAALVLLGCSHRDAGSPQPGGRPPDPAIVAKLEEMVALRQRMAESHRLLVEARLELAHERHQREEVLSELKKLVVIQQGRFERAKATSDRISAAGLDEIRVDLLRAELRLARERARTQL